MRKNILTLMLGTALCFGLTACGSGTTGGSRAAEPEAATETIQTETALENGSEAQEEETGADGTDAAETEGADAEGTGAQAAAPEQTEAAANGGNILIAYFSYTGNTEEAAQTIAEYTGGDLARIERAEEYGDLYEEAEAEILDGVHPEITVSTDSIEDYDTIFVGYPIWWDEAPAMIATFLAENDFSGKTIVPFCTSSSNDIGNSLHIFSELCPDAGIAEGLTANDLNDVEPWLQRLGLVE